MAGYMTKLRGNIYEGELVNGTAAPVKNGVILAHGANTDAGKLVMPQADADTKLMLKEITTLYDGVKAYRFVVNKLCGNYYLVENGYEVNNAAEYDTVEYTTPVNALLRAHPLTTGEEFVTDAVTGALTVGVEYGIKADGTVGAAG